MVNTDACSRIYNRLAIRRSRATPFLSATPDFNGSELGPRVSQTGGVVQSEGSNLAGSEFTCLLFCVPPTPDPADAPGEDDDRPRSGAKNIPLLGS